MPPLQDTDPAIGRGGEELPPTTAIPADTNPEGPQANDVPSVPHQSSPDTHTAVDNPVVPTGPTRSPRHDDTSSIQAAPGSLASTSKPPGDAESEDTAEPQLSSATRSKDSERREKVKGVLGTVWEGFKTALETAESLADACPPAKGAITGLLKVIDITEVRSGVEALTQRLTSS